MEWSLHIWLSFDNMLCFNVCTGAKVVVDLVSDSDTESVTSGRRSTRKRRSVAAIATDETPTTPPG